MTIKILEDLFNFTYLPQEAPTRFLYLSKIMDRVNEQWTILKLFVNAKKRLSTLRDTLT